MTDTKEHPVADGFDEFHAHIHYTLCADYDWKLSHVKFLKAAYTQGHTVGLAERVVVKDLVFKKEQGFYVAGLAITTTYKIEQKAGLWHLEINGFSFIGKKTKAEQIQNANAHHKAAVLAQIKETPPEKGTA